MLRNKFARRLSALEARLAPRSKGGLPQSLILHSKGKALSEDELAASLAPFQAEGLKPGEFVVVNVVETEPKDPPKEIPSRPVEEPDLAAEVLALEQRRRELKARKRKAA